MDIIKFVTRSLLGPENLKFYAWGNFEELSEKEILDPWIKLASTLVSTPAGINPHR